MTELTGHPVYRLLETKYDECQLDIVVLQPDGPYEGEVTHRRAVVEAFGSESPTTLPPAASRCGWSRRRWRPAPLPGRS